MCFSPLRKCHRGKTFPSRIESVSRTLASDFVSWSSVKTGSGASGKSPSILFTKGSGKFFTSTTEAYLNRVSTLYKEVWQTFHVDDGSVLEPSIVGFVAKLPFLSFRRIALVCKEGFGSVKVRFSVSQYRNISIPVHVRGEEC